MKSDLVLLKFHVLKKNVEISHSPRLVFAPYLSNSVTIKRNMNCASTVNRLLGQAGERTRNNSYATLSCSNLFYTSQKSCVVMSHLCGSRHRVQFGK